MIDSAMEYLRQGRSVIPMSPKHKRPLVAWSEFQSRLPTEQEVCDMFKQYSKAMVGMVTGKVSGVFVVDCDNDIAVEKIQSQLPESYVCPIAQTPRGGRHFYFQYPSDMDIPTKTSIFDHCDIRGQGGCIVCPPSINSKGGQYRWLDGLELTPESLQAPPEPLLALMRSLTGAHNIINKHIHTKGCGQCPPV
ncbi:MAG TPA: bifunctional DNA primase/polymerase [Candidatus Wunengus sp. YC60]|uniref:bifunctional DNA primase/polymerase n=1 Tax=Candidatus Wunengus sp. YC60 TaxID=3367697 RepID=UPI00402A32FB